MNQVGQRGLTADDLLWNWARWCWSGTTVGNMQAYVSWEDDHRPIQTDHAAAVDAMHRALPLHERMIIIAEYPQKNAMFGHLDGQDRVRHARGWIRAATGIDINEAQYKLYLGFFKEEIGRKLL